MKTIDDLNEQYQASTDRAKRHRKINFGLVIANAEKSELEDYAKLLQDMIREAN